ncbi:MAG: hypothetical protein Q8M88_17495 [Phenylobacterium sp.]|uniref:tyrosine phosphatase family protein n=1 Tax=Phenylobacterium sp. TaxID=1871053 RepID=UPI002734AE8F|nr:hypothetical protein [Phenylobacterium sp.]MDP3176221.1 hypothetical protein [Phenylobacterium sp.]
MVFIICGLSEVERLAKDRLPSHMITLIDPATPVSTPPSLTPSRHLRLNVNDITAPAEGLIAPSHAVVEKILGFGADWDEAAPMLIHCWAGISRSTATAFMLACERSAEADEREIALAMRRAAPHAFPNRRIVALADEVLGRRGRMVAALDVMGEFDHTLARPFDFAARHHNPV